MNAEEIKKLNLFVNEKLFGYVPCDSWKIWGHSLLHGPEYIQNSYEPCGHEKCLPKDHFPPNFTEPGWCLALLNRLIDDGNIPMLDKVDQTYYVNGYPEKTLELALLLFAARTYGWKG